MSESASSARKRGFLLLNLGTPDSPEPEDVGRYLKQFLMDKWVVDIPAPLRWFLVNVLIVPKRKYASSEAYKTVWGERGSPLMVHLKDLHEQLKPLLQDRETAIAMRYGNPSIEAGLRELQSKNVDEITIFPLYPQYAESTTRSSREEIERVAKEIGLKAKLSFVKDYFEHHAFVSTFAKIIRKQMKDEKPDHWLMSFHGIPERHVKRTDPSRQHCLAKNNCCDQIDAVNRDCYRAQCYATARGLARELGLGKNDYTVSFQSRLGRTPWIRPFTDEILPEFPKKGIKRLAVVCPSFAADCLETVEEIGDRGREMFIEAGGEVLHRYDCPNASPEWARAIVTLAETARS